MTKEKWLACNDLESLCDLLGTLDDGSGNYVSERKLRLFLIACLRRVLHFFDYYGLYEDASEKTNLIERYAEGLVPWSEFDRLRYLPSANQDPDAPGANECCMDLSIGSLIEFSAQDCLAMCDIPRYAELARMGVSQREVERHAQVLIFRDIIGNPFHSMVENPVGVFWKDATVRTIAHEIYEGRAFVRMPLLGDALRIAGCTDSEILEHCVAGRQHFRGCWLLDLILDKQMCLPR